MVSSSRKVLWVFRRRLRVFVVPRVREEHVGAWAFEAQEREESVGCGSFRVLLEMFLLL